MIPKGYKFSEEVKRKKSLALKGRFLSEQSSQWKGDNVQNRQLHAWVRKNLKQPEFCERCGIKQPKHLANITGIYSRDFSNWKYLCISCHRKIDNSIFNIKKMRIK